MADSPENSVTELLTPVLQAAGLFLEDVEMTRAGRYSTLRVVVDLPDGPGDLDLDTLQDVSQKVSAALDEADPVKGRYTLEVTSPGAERRLSTARHFRRAVGHQATVTAVVDGEERELSGTVTQADEESVTLEVEGRALRLALAEVRQARMVAVI